MTGPIRFQFDIGPLQKELRAIGANGDVIMARCLNRATTAGKTAMARAVTQDTGIRNKDITREIVLDKANRTKLAAALTIKGARLPLIAFQARGPEPSRGRGRGVSYRLPGGRGRVANAFIATMASGHRGVFRRKPGAKRHGKGPTHPQLPIFELRGPSLPHVFEKKVDVFATTANASLVKNLRHELDWARAKETGGGID